MSAASPLSKDEARAASDEGAASLPTEPLREGERVLTTGALELKTALANKLSETAKRRESRRLLNGALIAGPDHASLSGSDGSQAHPMVAG